MSYAKGVYCSIKRAQEEAEVKNVLTLLIIGGWDFLNQK